jgi:hypothetical protein
MEAEIRTMASYKKAHWEETEDLIKSRTTLDLMSLAKYFRFPEFSLDILNGDLAKAESDDPVQYANLVSQTKQRDSRDLPTYAKDAIAGWIVEDLTLVEFRKFGFMLRLNGIDKERKFTHSSVITNQADFILTYNGKEYPAELASTLEDSWIKYDSIWLRINKLDHLREQKALLIGTDLYTGKFALVSQFQSGLRYDDYTLFGKAGKRVFWPNGMHSSEYETTDPAKIKAIIEEHCAGYDR